jgi:hypothetical protein
MNSEIYDLFGLGGSSAARAHALAAVNVNGRVTVIDMREILGEVAPRDRRSLREAILCLAVSVLRTPLPKQAAAGE